MEPIHAIQPPPSPLDRGVRDADLDLPRASERPNRLASASYEGYQRLVANPFLALFAIEMMACVIAVALQAKNLPLTLLASSSLGFALLLFQYHCLDCGTTDRLARWRRHHCEAVLLRRVSKRRRRLRGPSPAVQTFLWLAALSAAALAALIVSL